MLDLSPIIATWFISNSLLHFAIFIKILLIEVKHEGFFFVGWCFFFGEFLFFHPTATSFGIALPAWIVDQKNSILVS